MACRAPIIGEDGVPADSRVIGSEGIVSLIFSRPRRQNNESSRRSPSFNHPCPGYVPIGFLVHPVPRAALVNNNLFAPAIFTFVTYSIPILLEPFLASPSLSRIATVGQDGQLSPRYEFAVAQAHVQDTTADDQSSQVVSLRILLPAMLLAARNSPPRPRSSPLSS